jgi:hypothetical protein
MFNHQERGWSTSSKSSRFLLYLKHIFELTDKSISRFRDFRVYLCNLQINIDFIDYWFIFNGIRASFLGHFNLS